MLQYIVTLSQLKNEQVTLDEVKDIFKELNIQTLSDFKRKKKEGILKIPSFDNLNALCLMKKGLKFEPFFFGVSELNKKKQKNLLNEKIIERVREWCFENSVTTLAEYRQKDHPPDFPTFKKTVDNYGEDYFYEIIGLKKRKDTFSEKLFDYKFIREIKEWCQKNQIISRREYNEKRPSHFPSTERIRQLTPGSDYWGEVLNLGNEKSK